MYLVSNIIVVTQCGSFKADPDVCIVACKVPFVFRKAHTNDPKPVNWDLLDEDAAVILRSVLKQVYSESNKCDLEEDEDIMIAFFGTLEHGQEVLGAHSEIDWENMWDGL